MRRRLIWTLCTFVAAGALLAGAGPAAGQTGPGGVNSREGGASNTRSGAEVDAQFRNAADPGAAGTGDGGGTSNYDCEWLYGPPEDERPRSESELQDIFDADGLTEGETMDVRLHCVHTDTGEVLFDDAVPWPGPTVEELIDPVELAIEARNSITLPVPAGRTVPPVEAGTYAQLPTYFSVENWDQTLTAEAVAGPVVVEVTANPVSQHWTVHDDHRGTEHTVDCVGAGSAAPEGEECMWTPAHSSAGQPEDNPWRGDEPCFRVTVSVRWEMTWTVNGEPGDEDLDDGWESGSMCLPVAEIQAVVDDG